MALLYVKVNIIVLLLLWEISNSAPNGAQHDIEKWAQPHHRHHRNISCNIEYSSNEKIFWRLFS